MSIIFWAAISDTSFALANAGLITHGDIYTCLGVIFIHYAPVYTCFASALCPLYAGL